MSNINHIYNQYTSPSDLVKDEFIVTRSLNGEVVSKDDYSVYNLAYLKYIGLVAKSNVVGTRIELYDVYAKKPLLVTTITPTGDKGSSV